MNRLWVIRHLGITFVGTGVFIRECTVFSILLWVWKIRHALQEILLCINITQTIACHYTKFIPISRQFPYTFAERDTAQSKFCKGDLADV